MSEKMREEFEAWAANRHKEESWAIEFGMFNRKGCGAYAIAWVGQEWEIWQASRQAAEIELPDGHGNVGALFWDGVHECQKAIESAGLRVKK